MQERVGHADDRARAIDDCLAAVALLATVIVVLVFVKPF